jgi:hypothetical protein
VIIVDASALLELLLQTPLGGRVEGRLFADEQQFHAPHLVDVEVTQGLRRISPTSISTVTRISISWPGPGSCARTSRRTTPCTYHWGKRSMPRSLPATPTSPEHRATAHDSNLSRDL